MVDHDKLEILKIMKKTNSCNLENAIITYATTNLKIESNVLFLMQMNM